MREQNSQTLISFFNALFYRSANSSRGMLASLSPTKAQITDMYFSRLLVNDDCIALARIKPIATEILMYPSSLIMCTTSCFIFSRALARCKHGALVYDVNLQLNQKAGTRSYTVLGKRFCSTTEYWRRHR